MSRQEEVDAIRRIEDITSLELIKNIAHTVIHRMTLWQFIFQGGYWRRQYDTACERLAEIQSKGESNDRQNANIRNRSDPRHP